MGFLGRSKQAHTGQALPPAPRGCCSNMPRCRAPDGCDPARPGRACLDTHTCLLAAWPFGQTVLPSSRTFQSRLCTATRVLSRVHAVLLACTRGTSWFRAAISSFSMLLCRPSAVAAAANECATDTTACAAYPHLVCQDKQGWNIGPGFLCVCPPGFVPDGFLPCRYTSYEIEVLGASCPPASCKPEGETRERGLAGVIVETLGWVGGERGQRWPRPSDRAHPHSPPAAWLEL